MRKREIGGKYGIWGLLWFKVFLGFMNRGFRFFFLFFPFFFFFFFSF